MKKFIIFCLTILMISCSQETNVWCGDHEGVDGGKKETPRSSRTHCINKKYTSSEIDYFSTFILGKCYLIPISECSTAKTLRFSKPKMVKKT